jgi:PAS domain S-box-containing protein
MSIYLNILLQFLFISSCILFLFKFRGKLGLAPLYILLGSVQYVQALSGALISFELFDSIKVYPGSIIMFSAVLFAVLLIYIKEGTASARTLIIGVIISNFILSALFAIIYAQQTLSLDVNEKLSSIFEVNYKYFLTGTLILFVDFILLVVIYQFLVSKLSRLFFFVTIFISLFLVLVFDAFVFNILLKFNAADFTKSLYGHLIGKSVSSFIFSVLLYVYLKYIDRDDSHVYFIANQNRDIFSIFKYRKRYFDLKEEKKEVEQKLTSKLETSLDNISDGFVTFDSNDCYTYANKMAGVINGTDSENLIGKNIWDILPAAKELPFYKMYYKAKETNTTQFNDQYYEPLNKWIESRIYPSQEGVTVYFRDITERKQMEYEIKKNEIYLNNIINNIGDPIFVKDAESKLLLVNNAFCNIFNLKKEEIIGKTLAEDVSIEERESFLKIDKSVIDTGIENINEETLTVREGETRTILTKKTRFINENGQKFLVGIIRDITDRKKAEIELQQHKNNLEEIIDIRTEEINAKNNELQRMNKLFVGRELKMIELKNIIKELQKENDK